MRKTLKKSVAMFTAVLMLLMMLQAGFAAFAKEGDAEGGYTQYTYAYTGEITKDRAAQAPAALETMLLKLLNENVPAIAQAGGLNAIVNQTLFTNANIGKILQTVFAALEKALSSNPLYARFVSPKLMTSPLAKKPQYADIKAYFDSQPNWTDMKEADLAALDWGFEDGDLDGFMTAFSAGSCGIMSLLNLLNPPIFNGTANRGQIVDDGKIGIYELLLVPLFEALGITEFKTSTQFTADYAALLAAGGSAELWEVVLRDILDPIFGLVEKVLEAPVPELLKLLPNLAAFLDSGRLATALSDSLARLEPMLKALKFELPQETVEMIRTLDGDAVMGLIAPMLEQGFDINGTKLSLKLPAIDWSKISQCGALTQRPSKALASDTVSYVEADEADAFMLVFDYVLKTLSQNSDTVIGLLSGIEGVGQYAALLESVIDDPDNLRLFLMNMLVPLPDEEPDTTEPDSTEPDSTVPDATEPDATEPSTDKQDEPKPDATDTGDAALAAMAALTLTAGAAFVCTRKARKH